jgi:hypothetical protein
MLISNVTMDVLKQALCLCATALLRIYAGTGCFAASVAFGFEPATSG